MCKFLKLKLLSSFLTTVFFCFGVYTAGIVYAAGINETACKAATAGGTSGLKINMNLLKTIDNMLPIRIGKIKVGENAIRLDSESDDGATSDSFMCVCDAPPPIFVRYGLSLSFWNPIGLVETSAIPNCYPSLGISLPIDVGASQSLGRRSDGVKDQYISSQTHYMSGINVLNAFVDVFTMGCLQADLQTGIDHISELLPWWQNDTWAVVFAPESLLVANPIAVAACAADSLAVSTTRKNIDPLFWCYGAWGASYPNTVNVGSGTPISSYALLAARTIASEFKSLKILKTSGKHMFEAQCQPYPTIFIAKNDLKMFPVWPQVVQNGFKIGYPAEIWGFALDNPTNMGVMTWAIYQKRDCCFL